MRKKSIPKRINHKKQQPVLTTIGAGSASGFGRGAGGGGAGIFTIGATTYDVGAGDVYNSQSTPEVSATMTKAGSFKVKMWGGGGNTGSGLGGVGGYSEGTVTFDKDQVFKIRVGGAGGQGTGGANGGGNADNYHLRGAGGGYTGIFAGSTSHANSVMIAGGGGGSGNPNGSIYYGGAGGGPSGRAGAGGSDGGGGSSGGTGGPCSGAQAGSQLQGGSGLTGGGGGYWGGGGGGDCGSYAPGGGGGSGYIGHPAVTDGLTVQGPDSPSTTPYNSSDPIRGTAGNTEAAGRIYIYWD